MLRILNFNYHLTQVKQKLSIIGERKKERETLYLLLYVRYYEVQLLFIVEFSFLKLFSQVRSGFSLQIYPQLYANTYMPLLMGNI
jgi:hypothetical protein